MSLENMSREEIAPILKAMCDQMEKLLPTVDPALFYHMPTLSGRPIMMRGDLVIEKGRILKAWSDAVGADDSAAVALAVAAYVEFENRYNDRRKVIECRRIGSFHDGDNGPRLDAQTADCSECGAPIWVSPRTATMVAAGSVAICKECASRLIVAP